MDRYSQNQYDDDLTLGDEYDDSYFSDSDDLFDLSPDEDSPLSRLKSLVLSIDWEITDEVLLMFNEELVSLRDVWAGEKINLVYVQALEKISKYIYARKADAHPSAIKLLLTLYHNLEKIVTSEVMTDEEKTTILREDVKAFELLKKHIRADMAGQAPPEEAVPAAEAEAPAVQAPVDEVYEEAPAPAAAPVEEPVAFDDEDEFEAESPLSLNVSGSEQGSTGALMRLKAIILGLDWEITDEYLTNLKFEVAELKEQYFENATRIELLRGIGEVGDYVQEKKSEAHSEAFKVLHALFEGLEQIVATPMSPEEERTSVYPLLERLQAFRMIVENNIQYREETPEDAPVAERSNDTSPAAVAAAAVSEVTPAFAAFDADEIHGFQDEEEIAGLGREEGELVRKMGNLFSDETGEGEEDDMLVISPELALQGVDVETEADDDSGESALPLDGDQLAPALATYETPEEDELELPPVDDVGVDAAVDNFFGEDDVAEPGSVSREASFDEEPVAALSLDDEEPVAALSLDDEEPVAALSLDDEEPVAALSLDDEEPVAALSFDDEEPVAALSFTDEEAAPLTLDDEEFEEEAITVAGRDGFDEESPLLQDELEPTPALSFEDEMAGPAPALNFEGEEELAAVVYEDTTGEVAAALGFDDEEEERPDFSLGSDAMRAAALEGVNVEEDGHSTVPLEAVGAPTQTDTVDDEPSALGDPGETEEEIVLEPAVESALEDVSAPAASTADTEEPAEEILSFEDDSFEETEEVDSGAGLAAAAVVAAAPVAAALVDRRQVAEEEPPASLSDRLDRVDAAMQPELVSFDLDESDEEEDALAATAMGVLETGQAQVGSLFEEAPAATLDAVRQESGLAAAAVKALETGSEEVPSPLESSSIDARVALEGVNVEIDDEDDIEETSAPFGEGVIAAVGGVADDGPVSEYAAGAADTDEFKEKLDGFFGADESVSVQPAAAPAVLPQPAVSVESGVVFLLAENDEEQDAVQSLRMSCEEFALNDTDSSFQEVLSARDRLFGIMQGRALELNLLQLFSTVADWLGRTGEPVGGESLELLRSTSQALAEVLADANIARDQEVLRHETARVLEWQGSLQQ